MTGVLRRSGEKTETDAEGRGQVSTEAEPGLMQPLAREQQSLRLQGGGGGTLAEPVEEH